MKQGNKQGENAFFYPVSEEHWEELSSLILSVEELWLDFKVPLLLSCLSCSRSSSFSSLNSKIFRRGGKNSYYTGSPSMPQSSVNAINCHTQFSALSAFDDNFQLSTPCRVAFLSKYSEPGNSKRAIWRSDS